MSDDLTPVEITEENTAPDAAEPSEDKTPADEEVGGTEVNFTTEAGTTEAPASLSDGTESDSTGSITQPLDESPVTSSDATGNSDPKPLAASEVSPAASDASSSAIDSEDAPSTEDDSAYENASDAQKALRGEHADGEGATHVGTDTPEKLISNPCDSMTGEPLFPKDAHSDEPLHFHSFSDAGEDEDAGGKVGRAIELLGEVRDSL